jgi:hypothetical protein
MAPRKKAADPDPRRQRRQVFGSGCFFPRYGGGVSAMMELTVIRVSLDFACCACNHEFGVTVECTGKGLTPGSRTLAAFNVDCPNCGQGNRVFFEPCGVIRDVVPEEDQPPRYTPSLN